MTKARRGATMMDRHVSISYASPDAAVANAVIENLEQHGIRCRPGSGNSAVRAHETDECAGTIAGCSVLVLVFSDHAIASTNVGREIERAATARSRIIVLRLDAASLTRSFEYFLRESQWIDVAALGVRAALAQLTQAVEQRLAPSMWVSPGLGTDVKNPADRKRKPSYLLMRRLGAAAMFLLAAAVVIGVLVRYWPSN